MALISNGETGSSVRTKLNDAINNANITGLIALAANGMLARSASGTVINRTITGTANEITLTNGDGVSGNPTISLPTALTFTGKTVTAGTFTAPTINGGTAAALTAFGIRSTGSGAFDLTLANTENLAAGRTLTIKVNDVARTIDIAGNITTAGAFITSGANSLTLTTGGATNVTLPTTGTLATLAGAEALSNKTSLNTHTIPGGTGTLALTSQLTAYQLRDAQNNLLYGPSSISTDYTILNTDMNKFKAITNSGASIVTIDAAAVLTAWLGGQIYIIRNMTASTNDITITPGGGVTFDGVVTITPNSSAVILMRSANLWCRIS